MDLNDLQDQIIAVNNLVTGQPQGNWTNVALAGALTVGGQAFTFNDFTFTADNTTDQLAATANPLQTGDGPLRPSNSGGSLPGGLSAGTDFYWIRVDANHGKAATSRANALAGIPIDITTNGSGTQTVVHQAGTTRVSDAEVTRNLTVDGNGAVGGTLSVTGAITASGLSVTGAITASGLAVSREIAVDVSAFVGDATASWTLDTAGRFITRSGGGGSAYAPLFVHVGATILTFTQFYNVNSSGAGIQAKIRRIVLATGAINDVAATITDSSGSVIESQTVSGINHVVLAGNAYFIEATMTASGARIHGSVVTYQ